MLRSNRKSLGNHVVISMLRNRGVAVVTELACVCVCVCVWVGVLGGFNRGNLLRTLYDANRECCLPSP